MNDPVLIKISSDQWQEFKEIRLQALKNEPAAYHDTYEGSLAYPEEKWQELMTKRNAMVFVTRVDNEIVGKESIHTIMELKII